MKRLRIATIGAALVGVVAGVLVALPSAPSASTPDRAYDPGGVPEPVRPAFSPPPPIEVKAQAPTVWAPVLRGTQGRARPSFDADVVGALEQTTPEGTENIALVLETTRDEAGETWARVPLAVLPNGTVAWVPRDVLGGYVQVRTRLVVDRTRLVATLYRGNRRVFSAPVGVGRAPWPTPVGRFYVRNRLTGFDDPAYGPLAFGTSARSPVLTDWPAGGYIGIHGTDRPDLLPGRVSHGCIRLRNEDIIELARLMPVGTPITIR
jgi:hypothetical protein